MGIPYEINQLIEVEYTQQQNKFEPEVGDKFTIKGTVKDHKEFKGWKSTMLTRVKMA